MLPGIPGTDACRVVQCMAALRIFSPSFPSLSCMTYACILRQEGKFSSNLLLSAHLTYVPTGSRSGCWKRQELGAFIYRIYTTLSLCSHFGSSLSTPNIYRSTSRLFLRNSGGSTASISLCSFLPCIDIITSLWPCFSITLTYQSTSTHIYNVFQHRSAALGFLLVHHSTGFADSKHNCSSKHRPSQRTPGTRCT